LDFDNIFGGLLEVDRVAALALAERPEELVARLAALDAEDGTARALLVRRAYLNPNGSVPDEELGNDRGRLFLSRFRPHLMRAGFEVIDCPALTRGQKNAADIRMVLDMADLLRAPVHLDEFVIASSDADFTPLLLRLRAEDRRTVVLTAGALAPPYRAVADRHLDEHQLIELLRGAVAPSDQAASDLVDVPGPSDAGDTTEVVTDPSSEQEALTVVAHELEAATSPIHLSHLGNQVHRVVGSDVVRATRWFGQGSLRAFVLREFPTWRSEGHHVWDPERHEAPAPPPSLSGSPEGSDERVPPLIAQLGALADLPRLSSATWPTVFEVLEQYAATHPFSLTEATSWSRDALAERGVHVGRQALGFVVRGCLLGSVSLARVPPPTSEELRTAFAASMIARAESQGLDLADGGRAGLLAWLAGEG
jgi:hypothetical protein